jgi:hypothetical protein
VTDSWGSATLQPRLNSQRPFVPRIADTTGGLTPWETDHPGPTLSKPNGLGLSLNFGHVG